MDYEYLHTVMDYKLRTPTVMDHEYLLQYFKVVYEYLL